MKKKNDKTTDNIYILKKMSKYLYRYKFLIIISIILTFVSNTFSLVGPMLSGYAIEEIERGAGNIDFSKIFYYGMLMMGFYLASSILSYLISIVMVKTARNVIYSLREDAFDTLVNLPISYFDKTPAGDILSRLIYDIDTMGSTLSTDLVNILTSIFTMVGSFVMMFAISKKLILVFFITIPMSILSTKFITSKTRPLFRERAKKIGRLNSFVEEHLSGLKVIKAYNKERETVEEFKKINRETVESYYNAEYYGSITMAIVSFINNLSLAFISIGGSILYIFGQMSLGQISSFVLYSKKFSGPIKELSNLISDLQSTFAASERVFRFIDEAKEKEDGLEAREIKNIKGKLDMKNIAFSYDLNKTVLEDLNIHAKPNSVIAIVGPTGSGKSTIINLLMKFYHSSGGEILIDDVNIDDIKKNSLRRSYAMVLQDSWLFDGTIYENIVYGNENATLEDVKRVCKLAQIDDFINKLPNGYDTYISGNGDNISKGQKQLINIARAMLVDANILILDEATSNIDSKTEVQIQNALLEIMKGKTCFIIAHRLSTIKNADQILVINQGKIVENGKHFELLESDGFYASLFKSQFES